MTCGSGEEEEEGKEAGGGRTAGGKYLRDSSVTVRRLLMASRTHSFLAHFSDRNLLSLEDKNSCPAGDESGSLPGSQVGPDN